MKGMKELPVLFVGTQRGTNPGSWVHTAVWRTHLVRVILSQHLREFGIKRLEYFGLCAPLEFDYVILRNRSDHGMCKTVRDANIPSPCGQHPVKHKFTLHVDGVNRRVDALGKGRTAAPGLRIGSPWWRAYDTFQMGSIGVGQLPTGIGTNDFAVRKRSSDTNLCGVRAQALERRPAVVAILRTNGTLVSARSSGHSFSSSSVEKSNTLLISKSAPRITDFTGGGYATQIRV